MWGIWSIKRFKPHDEINKESHRVESGFRDLAKLSFWLFVDFGLGLGFKVYGVQG